MWVLNSTKKTPHPGQISPHGPDTDTLRLRPGVYGYRRFPTGTHGSLRKKLKFLNMLKITPRKKKRDHGSTTVDHGSPRLYLQSRRGCVTVTHGSATVYNRGASGVETVKVGRGLKALNVNDLEC